MLEFSYEVGQATEFAGSMALKTSFRVLLLRKHLLKALRFTKYSSLKIHNLFMGVISRKNINV